MARTDREERPSGRSEARVCILGETSSGIQYIWRREHALGGRIVLVVDAHQHIGRLDDGAHRIARLQT